jgi:hypothetical protein
MPVPLNTSIHKSVFFRIQGHGKRSPRLNSGHRYFDWPPVPSIDLRVSLFDTISRGVREFSFRLICRLMVAACACRFVFECKATEIKKLLY